MLEILKENGKFSLPRVLCCEVIQVWLISTVASMVLEKEFACYTEFTGAAVSCLACLIGNKYINGKYNTPPGSAGKP